VAGGPEGGGGVARKLPRDDVVLMVGLAGARGQWIDGKTARPSGGASSTHRRSGPVVPLHESEIGKAGEHQWVVAVL
jgi:hypothetical protein